MKEHFPTHNGSGVDTLKMGYWLRKFAGRVVKVDGKNFRFARDDGGTHGTARWKTEDVS
jgi:hypothetical protein